MADQHIFFEQGSVTTGDSGERGSNAEGIASVKPVDDGERASKATFNRPTENIRLRTEALRTAGEAAKYLLDSNTKWIITAGNADGLSPGPLAMPGVSYWDSAGGTFTTSSALVVQPMNTPDSDKQETKVYSFTDGLAQNATISFTPLSDADPQSSGVVQKRAYNGANLIRIKWEEVPAASLASAVVPNYCDVEIAGDPEHTLIITIRDDDTTQMSNVQTALQSIETAAGQLGDIGLGYVIAGTVATSLLYSVVSGDADYRMKGTFEREVHYIPAATFVDFFATPNTLADGDTLAIQYASLTTPDDSAVQPTGRRESVPSNNTTTFADTTTVAASNLFITSNADDVYKIPLCIPLCKRIGDDLYWIDGTVVTGAQTAFPVYFGENGVSVQRVADILALDSTVTGNWLFEGVLSVGSTRDPGATGTHLVFSDTATAGVSATDIRPIYNAYTVGHAVTGDVVGLVNSLTNNAAVSDFVAGIHNAVVNTDDPGSRLVGGLQELTVSTTGSQSVGEVYGQIHDVTFNGTTTTSQAMEAGGVKTLLALQGGNLFSVSGHSVVASSVTGTASTINDLTGYKTFLHPPSTAAVGVIYGHGISIESSNAALTETYGTHQVLTNEVSCTTVGGVYTEIVNNDTASLVVGDYTDITNAAVVQSVLGEYTNIQNSAEVTTLTGAQYLLNTTGNITGTLTGLKAQIQMLSSATVSDYVIGFKSTSVTANTLTGVRGVDNIVSSGGDATEAAIGIRNTITNSGSTPEVLGVSSTASNTGTLTDLVGWKSTTTGGGTISAAVTGIHNITTNSIAASGVYGGQNNLTNTGSIDNITGWSTSVVSNGAVSGEVYGLHNQVTIASSHDGQVCTDRSVLTVTNTASAVTPETQVREAFLYLSGTLTTTQITDVAGDHIAVHLAGGTVTSNVDGLFIDIPENPASPGDVSIGTLTGLRIDMKQPPDAVSTKAYGAHIKFDNTYGPSGATDTAALWVESESSAVGVHVDTTSANYPLIVGPGSAAAQSSIERSLYLGSGTSVPQGPSTGGTNVTLHIGGAFQTYVTTLGTSSLSGTDTIDAENKSVIYVTGDDSPGSFQDIATLSYGVSGQWLIIINNTDSGGSNSVDLTFVETGNIKIAGATSTIISTGESIQFVYAGDKWWEVYRGA